MKIKPFLTSKSEREEFLSDNPQIAAMYIDGNTGIVKCSGELRMDLPGRDLIPVPKILKSILIHNFTDLLKKIRKREQEDYPALKFSRKKKPVLRWTAGTELTLTNDTEGLIEVFNKIGFTVDRYTIDSNQHILTISAQQPANAK